MRRPLLMVCLCLVALRALLYFVGGPPKDDLPDGAVVSLTGRVCQRDDNSFYLKVQKIAAVSRQQNQDRNSNQNPNRNPNQNSNQEINQAEYLVHRKVICECGDGEKPRLGSFVVLQGSLEAFSRATNPGEFDYAKYYHSIGIAGRIKDVEILGGGESYSPIQEFLYRLKCFWQRRLYRIFPEKEASVMTAVLLGDKSGLDSRVKELYQSNGVIHILSISGLHITVIGLGLYKLLRRLGVPVWPAALFGGTVLVLYGIMTGLSVSACRAIGMYLLRMLAQLCGRTYDMLTALGVMAVLLVWNCPGYLEYMGFWLSFGSILGVGVLCPALTPAQDERGMGSRRYVEGALGRFAGSAGKSLLGAAEQGLLAGISVTLTTLPLQLWFVYEVPVYSVFLNMLILPLMSAVMAFGLAAMLVPGLGVAGTADVLILSWYERLCALFEKLPFHTWNPGRPRLWQVVLYYVLWLAVARLTDRYRQRRKKSRRRERESPGGMLVGKILILSAAVLVLAIPVSRGDRVIFLDVGQGDCILAQLSTGEAYLFDCGSSSRGRIGERVLIPCLKYYGIRHVDGVFLSHPDTDHASGLLELLALGKQEHITVGQVVLPGIGEQEREEKFREVLEAVRAAPQKKPIAVEYVNAGDTLWEGKDEPAVEERKQGVLKRFVCLHPPTGFPTGNDNAYSGCFYMELGSGFSLLLTGDVESKGEEALLHELRRLGIGNVTVLKIAHHGSRYSTSEELLEQASPALAIISCGRRNRYGHPHAELLERLRQQGCEIRRTDESGAIILVIRKNRVTVEEFAGKRR